jgi:hypothetical protein
MAAKKIVAAPKAQKMTVAEEVALLEQGEAGQLPTVGGIVFRWVNQTERHRRGWSIWTPVEVDSEMGVKVQAWKASKFQQFEGIGATSSYFLDGAGGILAYTSVEKHMALKTILRDKARNQLKLTMTENETKVVKREVRMPHMEVMHTGDE